MTQEMLITLFLRFGLAGLLGFLIGLEREMRDEESVTLGIRDFVLFSLLGAVSGYTAIQYDNSWLIIAGFLGFIALVVSSFWAERGHGPGITSEIAAVVTFFLGVMIMQGAAELAIALAIVTLGVLFPKRAIKRFRARVQAHEMQAVLLFLVITFIILPILPRQSLDTYITFPVGTVTQVDAIQGAVTVHTTAPARAREGERLQLLDEGWRPIGELVVSQVNDAGLVGRYEGETPGRVQAGVQARARLGIPFLYVMLSALQPYKIWLIVVLVSFISFVGYVLIKVIGSGAGIGLTGLIGGMVSSTVTTLSFARRSKESPRANALFAGAVILASSIMFPRLILEIAVVNTELMKAITLPLTVMGVTGFLSAGYLFWRTSGSETADATVRFDNPFSLKSAVSFALVFATILMATRLATHYLGNVWLPAVALVSGLTDADAIAFSISDLQATGLVSTHWAGFNLVLGALSNTMLKLFLVLSLGHRELFKQLRIPFAAITLSGILTMLVYYDLFDTQST